MHRISAGLVVMMLLCALPAAPGGPAGVPGVSFTIAPETYISSDSATLCRVVATNHSGRTLNAKTLVFEARAREHGRVVARERGRFGGLLENGATVETVIAFTGSFHDFEVGPAGAGDSGRSASRRRGSKGAAGRSRTGRKRKPSRTR